MSDKNNPRRRNRARLAPKLCHEARWIGQRHKCKPAESCYVCDMARKRKLRRMEPADAGKEKP